VPSISNDDLSSKIVDQLFELGWVTPGSPSRGGRDNARGYSKPVTTFTINTMARSAKRMTSTATRMPSLREASVRRRPASIRASRPAAGQRAEPWLLVLDPASRNDFVIGIMVRLPEPLDMMHPWSRSY
jgi:hypothetical protein